MLKHHNNMVTSPVHNVLKINKEESRLYKRHQQFEMNHHKFLHKSDIIISKREYYALQNKGKEIKKIRAPVYWCLPWPPGGAGVHAFST